MGRHPLATHSASHYFRNAPDLWAPRMNHPKGFFPIGNIIYGRPSTDFRFDLEFIEVSFACGRYDAKANLFTKKIGKRHRDFPSGVTFWVHDDFLVTLTKRGMGFEVRDSASPEEAEAAWRSFRKIIGV